MYKTIQALLWRTANEENKIWTPEKIFPYEKTKEKNASSIVAPSSEEKEEIAINLLCDKNIVVSNPKSI